MRERSKRSGVILGPPASAGSIIKALISAVGNSDHPESPAMNVDPYHWDDSSYSLRQQFRAFLLRTNRLEIQQPQLQGWQAIPQLQAGGYVGVEQYVPVNDVN